MARCSAFVGNFDSEVSNVAAAFVCSSAPGTRCEAVHLGTLGCPQANSKRRDSATGEWVECSDAKGPKGEEGGGGGTRRPCHA